MKGLKQGAFIGSAAIVFAGVIAVHSAVRPVEKPAAGSAEVRPADPQSQMITARTTAKAAIAGELIAGRRSLLEAAAAFRDLGLQGPPDHVRDAFPLAASEDEAYCRSVLVYIDALATQDQGDDLACSLEAELYDRLRDGTLRLPDAEREDRVR